MITLTSRDVLQLQALVAGAPLAGSVTGVRDLSGLNNNLANPTFGTADTPFLRLTAPSYGAPIYTDVNGVSTLTQLDVNPIFAGLDPRAISNVVGAQGATTPVQSAGANMLFSAFGQYFDHGLTATMKGGSGTLLIGAPGTGRAPGTDNPADLTRASVAGFDAAGVPQHLNNTSAFIDQNQAYGANQLVGTFLRETDGQGGVGAKLAVGGRDPSNPAFDQIPTLRALILAHWENNTVFAMGEGTVSFRDYHVGLVDEQGQIDLALATNLYKNFMGSGQPLLVDLNPYISPLDHVVGGDGRANENITLTAIHTIWARNHNMHVDSLRAAGFEGSAEAIFQAAKIINETETSESSTRTLLTCCSAACRAPDLTVTTSISRRSTRASRMNSQPLLTALATPWWARRCRSSTRPTRCRASSCSTRFSIRAMRENLRHFR